jgi:hypothetical protein
MATTQGSFVWYELMSSDVAASKAFYSEVVGWSTEDVPMPGMTYTILRIGEMQVGGMMALPKEASAAGMRPGWFGYVGVEDADRAAAKVAQLGGKILMPPTDIPNVGRFAMAVDPRGASLYLFKPAQAGQRAVSNEPGQVGWHELHTNDWQKAFEFYTDMFGWLKGDSMDMGPMGTYQLFTINGTPSGAMLNSPAAQPAPFWLYYFNVGDIDDAIKRLSGGGGKITNGPMEVPGGRWVVQASDPQGAAFALLGSRK